MTGGTQLKRRGPWQMPCGSPKVALPPKDFQPLDPDRSGGRGIHGNQPRTDVWARLQLTQPPEEIAVRQAVDRWGWGVGRDWGPGWTVAGAWPPGPLGGARLQKQPLWPSGALKRGSAGFVSCGLAGPRAPKRDDPELPMSEGNGPLVVKEASPGTEHAKQEEVLFTACERAPQRVDAALRR